ncbi:hypothetical protein [Bacillus sp. FJAT-44742]|uniref:hypothetical protein n=1 Tax=Bacillus sp. FJAT-44742 TaxID=2014005 RepID=UPI000C244831|nr:hypothetical protein [Bacillus sp. FJAT-44742]
MKMFFEMYNQELEKMKKKQAVASAAKMFEDAKLDLNEIKRYTNLSFEELKELQQTVQKRS